MENIQYVLDQLLKIVPLKGNPDIFLVGHSNGGDMSVLFGEKYPNRVKKVITLDHRRMPVPRTDDVFYYSLRGSDYEADPGVLPSFAEQQEYSIRIVNLEGIRHSDMDDKGTPEQHTIIKNYVLQFLED